MHYIFSLAAILFLAMPVAAQSVKDSINTIKQDAGYFNAEETAENSEEAYNTAIDALASEVENSMPGITRSEILPKLHRYDLRRGAMTRVFVFVAKKELGGLTLTAVATNPAVGNESLSNQTSAIVTAFSQLNTLSEVTSLLSEYKEEGKVTDYGWVRSLNIAPDSNIIILRGEAIAAVLCTTDDGHYLNVITQQNDAITNYSGCRAIWFK